MNSNSDYAEKGGTIRLIAFVSLMVLATVFSWQIYSSGTAPNQNVPEMGPAAAQGRLLYQQYNCTACHQQYGLGGYMGPDLTNAWSRPGRGEAYIRAVLQNGMGIMPNYGLRPDEIGALAAYLEYIDGTGKYPRMDVDQKWYGTFSIPEHDEENH